MVYEYCPHCGTKSILKEIGDEGLMHYCDTCKVPLWDAFSTCIICAVTNELGEVALLKQSYVNSDYYVALAGHIIIGESVEETIEREVMEEIGQKVEEFSFVRSYPYEKKDLLMLGFHVKVKKQELKLSGEVDEVIWVPVKEAAEHMRKDSIAQKLIMEVAEKY